MENNYGSDLWLDVCQRLQKGIHLRGRKSGRHQGWGAWQGDGKHEDTKKGVSDTNIDHKV